MSDITAAYVFSSATVIFYSEVNRNFDDLFCMANGGLDSNNLSPAFSWPASGVRYSACQVATSPLYSSLQVEGALDEIGGDWYRVTGSQHTHTAVTTALDAFDSQITTLESANYYTPKFPNLIWQNCTTIEIEANTDQSNTTALRFPNGRLRRVTETSATRRFRFLTITQTTIASATLTAQAGLSQVIDPTTTTPQTATICVYAVGICGTTEFTLAGKINMAPNESAGSGLISSFGSQNYVYLGTVKMGSGGSQSGASAGILSFVQNNDLTVFTNSQSLRSHCQAGYLVTDYATSADTTLDFVFGNGILDNALYEVAKSFMILNTRHQNGSGTANGIEILFNCRVEDVVIGWSSKETICQVGVITEIPLTSATVNNSYTFNQIYPGVGYNSVNILGFRDRYKKRHLGT